MTSTILRFALRRASKHARAKEKWPSLENHQKGPSHFRASKQACRQERCEQKASWYTSSTRISVTLRAAKQAYSAQEKCQQNASHSTILHRWPCRVGRALRVGLGADEQQLAVREVEQRGVCRGDPRVPACALSTGKHCGSESVAGPPYTSSSLQNRSCRSSKG